MTTDRRTEQLFEFIRRVREILAEGRRSLADPGADQWKALALARWDMLRALDRLNRYKRLYVLDPIRIQGSTALTARAQRMVHGNFELLDGYRRFVERWSLISPLSVDADYRREAAAMGTRIEQRMAEDGRELDALLHDSDAAGQARMPDPDSRHASPCVEGKDRR